MNARKCEFMAQNLEIEIVPRITERVIHLISGDVGPFEASIPAKVPVWMATMLKRKHHCHIVCPEWMTVDELKQILAAENEIMPLTQLPDFFFELSHILVREAHDDIKDVDQVKSLIQDIYDKREAKLRTSTLEFLSKQRSVTHARMSAVQPIEIAGARTTLKACRQLSLVIRNHQQTTQH
ncbi:unnamed protein product [Caenorhabditis auriculariae]|uniref:DNA replication complex GINS protein PSF2 n=1 Tax=Caenorhabditis auriculariae TaxID=2777116 RepID=A0A8S1GPJ2_9PELO|nr:unnamed protein product [Caenorhabditis auriculariae]